VALEAVDDPAYLGGIRNDGDDGHAGSAARASQDVDRVDLGQQPSPSLTAGKRVDLAAKSPARGTVLRDIRKRWLGRGVAAVPVGRRTRAKGDVMFPGSAPPRGIQPVAAHKVLPSGGNMQRHLGDEIQRGVAADLALEEPRGGSGPGDGVLLLVPTDAPQGKRCSHEVLAESLARGLVEDSSPTLD